MEHLRSIGTRLVAALQYLDYLIGVFEGDESIEDRPAEGRNLGVEGQGLSDSCESEAARGKAGDVKEVGK